MRGARTTRAGLPIAFLALAAFGLTFAPDGAQSAPVPAPQPTSFLSHAFGLPVEIEVLGLDAKATEPLFEQAVAELTAITRLTDPANPVGDVARLNRAALEGSAVTPIPVDPRLARLLARGRDFCFWSEGASGPLAGDLYALWGLRSGGAVPTPPPADRLSQAVVAAGCGGIEIDTVKATVRMAPGARLETHGYLEGLGVDRIAEILQAGGVKSFLVRVGTFWRARGPGTSGAAGWAIDLPSVPGLAQGSGRILLKDRSLAVIVAPIPASDHPGRRLLSYLNQRTGRPGEGVAAVATITDFALDAEGLAVTLFVIGPREGQLRLGSLTPKPSASWWMGSGSGTPLQVHYRWSETMRP